MTIDRAQLKNDAKQALRAAKPHPALVAAVFFSIVLLLGFLSMQINGQFDACRQMFTQYLQTGSYELVEPQGASGFGGVLSLALDVLSILMTVGFTLYGLRVFRRTQAGVGTLFDSFAMFFRGLVTYVYQAFIMSALGMLYMLPTIYLMALTQSDIWTFVCLPLLIPSVIAAYRYKFSMLVMLENDSLRPIRCLMVSRFLTRGQKWKLFKFDLSFLGWAVLGLIPVTLLWSAPYYVTALSGYYCRVTEELSGKNEPPKDTPPA